MYVLFESESENLRRLAQILFEHLQITYELANSMKDAAIILAKDSPDIIVINIDEIRLSDGVALRRAYKGEVIGWVHDHRESRYNEWIQQGICDKICYWVDFVSNTAGILTAPVKDASVAE